MLNMILTVLQVLCGLAVIAVVMLQSGKSAGLSGAIAGGADTFLSKNKAKSVDAKLAKMTKEEKAEYKTRQLEKELADLKRQNAVTEMAKTARKMLADEEINIPDELLGHLVSDNAEDTKTAVESFSKLYKAAVQAAVKEALKGNSPKSGSGGKSMTKEQIMAVSNPLERQKLIAENIALFQ